MRNRFKLFVGAAGMAVSIAACGGGDSSAEAFCGMESRFEDLDPDFSTEEGMAEAAEVLQELEDAAPAEIKDDVAVVRTFFTDLGPSLSDPEKLAELDMEELEEMSAQMDSAGANIEAFIDENC